MILCYFYNRNLYAGKAVSLSLDGPSLLLRNVDFQYKKHLEFKVLVCKEMAFASHKDS